MKSLTLILLGIIIANVKGDCTITNIKNTQRISCTNITIEDYLSNVFKIKAGLLNSAPDRISARISIEIEDSYVPVIDDWLFVPWDDHSSYIYSLTVVRSSVNSVKSLSKLSLLETLNFGGNNISDYRFLSKMKKLRHLHLSHSKLCPDSYLFTYLQRDQTRLNLLDLSYCNLSQFGTVTNLIDKYDFSFNPNLSLIKFDYKMGLRHPFVNLSGNNNFNNITFKRSRTNAPFCVSLDLSNSINRTSDVSLLNHVYISEQLLLSNNDIPVLNETKYNFSNLMSQKCSGRPSIDLSNCRLANMSTHIFSSLTLNLLNLSNNHLTSLTGSFFRQADILSLDMSNSSITFISPSVFNYLIVDTLDLSRNNLSSLNGIFDYIESMKNLDISSNPIETLSEDNFKNCRDLENLNLANAFVKTFGANALYNIASLKTVTLSFKNSINSTAIHNPHLIELIISNSTLSHLTAEQFKGFYKLRKLTFIHTSVSAIDSSAFKGLFNMKKINNLKDIGNYWLNIFQQLYSLEYLDLSNHKLGKLNEELHDLYSLKKLNLSSNELTSVNINSFITHKQLEILALSNNQLSTIAVGTFRELSKLTHLYLNKNQLQQLEPGIFSGLTNLHLLDLSQNDLIRTKPHLVFGVSMPKLTYLYLQGNGLGNEYAKSDDAIRRSEFVVISNHNHLKYVDINWNGWRCPTLIDVLTLFRNKNISCSPTSPDYTKNNINGVSCT